MRLSQQDARTITQIVDGYDSNAVTKLFGSQILDDARGGDIDILILSMTIGLEEKLQIEADLQDALGLRRFDILVARPDSSDPFIREVEETALVL